MYLWYNCSLCVPCVLSRACNLSSVNSWFHPFSWGKNSPAIITPCFFWWGRCTHLPAFRVGNLTLYRKKMKEWERALLFPEHQSYWSLLWIFVLWPFHPTSVSTIITPALFTLLFLWLCGIEDNITLWLGQSCARARWPARTHVLFGQAAVSWGLCSTCLSTVGKSSGSLSPHLYGLDQTLWALLATETSAIVSVLTKLSEGSKVLWGGWMAGQSSECQSKNNHLCGWLNCQNI